MFTKDELQITIKTLTHRRDWLVKNLNTSEQAEQQVQNQQTLSTLERVLSKLLALDEKSDTPKDSLLKSTPQQRRQQLEPEKIRVLLADDDETNAALITTFLQNLGIKIIDVADDGLKAINMLFNANPLYDLVLCDWNMPIKSGLDVHNAMRAAERYQGTCFMLVTAVTEAKLIRAAIEEGVDDYLAKPVVQDTFNKKIARIFPQIGID
jgi:two-component system chemotaxis response regulator CheY